MKQLLCRNLSTPMPGPHVLGNSSSHLAAMRHHAAPQFQYPLLMHKLVRPRQLVPRRTCNIGVGHVP